MNDLAHSKKREEDMSARIMTPVKTGMTITHVLTICLFLEKAIHVQDKKQK
jgi:hypothetical protein